LPRLTDEEFADVQERVRPATLIDYLYRLRINTNYKDSAMFTDGPNVPSDSKRVRRCFGILAGTTMLLGELAVIRRLGKQQVLDWATAWKRANVPPDIQAGLAARLDALNDCLP
jgi:hypothetical protein